MWSHHALAFGALVRYELLVTRFGNCLLVNFHFIDVTIAMPISIASQKFELKAHSINACCLHISNSFALSLTSFPKSTGGCPPVIIVDIIPLSSQIICCDIMHRPKQSE